MSFCIRVSPIPESAPIFLRIPGDESFFWQWDVGQHLIATGLPVGCEVHMYHSGITEPYGEEVYEFNRELICDVKDELLQKSGNLTVYAYQNKDGVRETVYQRVISIKERPKPPEYIPGHGHYVGIVDVKIEEVI